MKKIRTYNNIAAKGLNKFPADSYLVDAVCENPDAILLRSHKLQNETLPESILAIARAGAGVNNIPVADYTPQGIVVFNTPGANANAVKELVLASLLLSSRGISQSMSYVDSLASETDPALLHKKVEAGKKQYGGSELEGKTLGVVGLGAIGAKIANLALSLGMKVIGYDPKLSVEAAWQLSSNVKRAANLNSLLARSDFVTLHVPMIEATRGLMNSDAFSAIKEGAKLINLARGELVEEAAVISALDSGKLTSYIADFPSEALIAHDKVVLFPHLGASTVEAEENCAEMGAEQLIDFLDNGNILVFNNGNSSSSVQEINLSTQSIVWEYAEGFFSDHISGAQRLENGNTIVCSGVEGEFFEVTPAGEIVWEYNNPYLSQTPNGDLNSVFKIRKYNIELTLFINPYHYTYLDIIRENGYWSSFENFKQVLVNTVNIHGKGDVALWDFAQYSDYTVSAVPLKKDINSAFNWFWEPAHYKVELGELILAEMFGQNCTKNNAQPVGMKLNNINMKDYLLNENKRRKNLLNRKIIEK